MTPRIARIGIVAKQGLAAASEHLARLETWLRERGIDVVYETSTALLMPSAGVQANRSRDDLPNHVDLIIVLGGDGTLLSVADRIAQAGRNIPILGVNFGSLGFLTEIRIDELYPSLEALVDGTATYDERLMLSSTATLRGKADERRVVLNDVVFTKGALSRMIELSVSVSGRFVTCVKADGLIIASATGSTAYNLAAGGPIVHPSVDALVLTPIAPHTLTNRPVVIPADAEVEVRPESPSGSEDVFVTYDGQYGYAVHQGDVIRVGRAQQVLRLVKAPSRGYFELLREKLKWGER
ncbi:MAG TPA: NAD(+)/NADH kinase [Vicinamibacterales bacterium]|jgi:NAD+ kinase|nr:NAD(+)/NADH kinase [Vicinamibacterales bacterium]